MAAPYESGTYVRHYLGVLGRRKWVLFLCVLVVTSSALTFSLLQTPVYESHARVAIEPSQSLFQSGDDSVDPGRMQTEIEFLQSEPVKAAVRDRLGSAPPVSASVVGTTSIVDVAAQSTRPSEAALAANAYAETYVDYRRKRAIDGLLAATAELQQKLAELDRQIADADARALAANPRGPGNPSPPQTPEQQALQGQRAAFKQKFDQVQVDVALKNGGSQLVAPAAVPTEPIRPTTVRNVLLGLLVGLIVGTGLAFLADQFDDSLKTRDDFTRAADGLPILGVIPRMTGQKSRKNRKAEPRLVSLAEPSSPGAEAYLTLRTSIQYLGVDQSVRTLLVTSPTSSDGKTLTIANLAVALARAGQRVTVMSCDLRRPRIHELFDLPNSVGFTSVLVGAAALPSALQQVAAELDLRVLASGPIPPNPSELLSSRRAAEVIAALTADSDVVLIDCPPVLPVTDATVLSTRVDATLLVAMSGSTTGKQLHRAVELLRQVDAPLVGLVMNGAPPEDVYGYEYVHDPYAERSTNGPRAAAGKRRTKGSRRSRRHAAAVEGAVKGSRPVADAFDEADATKGHREVLSDQRGAIEGPETAKQLEPVVVADRRYRDTLEELTATEEALKEPAGGDRKSLRARARSRMRGSKS